MTDLPTRCFVCRARDWRETGRALRFGARLRRYALSCGHCGVLADRDWRERRAADRLADALSRPVYRSDPDAPFGMDPYTLRTAATVRGLAATGLAPEQAAALRDAHAELPAEARLEPLASSPAEAVALAILCRETERDEAVRRAAALRPAFAEALVLVDAAGGEAAEGGVRVVCRPLAGDFAAQRNAAQDRAAARWVFQLDLDETVSGDLAARLGALARLADGGGCLSVGFPRLNLVDGAASDLHPDVQYRLNRREVRYRGAVHERPDLGGRWRQGFVALCGRIEHHLTRERVETRSAAYEAIAPGRGRTHERDRLLEPYRP
jgi:hypothetical protein